MIFGVLADLLLFVHVTFMKFVALGGLMVIRWRWLIWIHLPSAILGLVMAISGWFWPFEGLERWLRVQGATRGYTLNLVDRFVPVWLNPAFLPRWLELGIGLLVFALNVYIYRRIYRQRRLAGATAP
jgi:Protein of Unknown function (DUF2784)